MIKPDSRPHAVDHSGILGRFLCIVTFFSFVSKLYKSKTVLKI